MLTNFQNSFTSSKRAMKWSLKITPYLKGVAALPCNLSVQESIKCSTLIADCLSWAWYLQAVEAICYIRIPVRCDSHHHFWQILLVVIFTASYVVLWVSAIMRYINRRFTYLLTYYVYPDILCIIRYLQWKCSNLRDRCHPWTSRFVTTENQWRN